MKNKVTDWKAFYTSFNGRATRYDFNVRYALMAFAGMIVAGILDVTFTGASLLSSQSGPFATIWNILILWPTFAITCRRLHDLNYSGWLQLYVHVISLVFVTVLVITLGASLIVNPLAAGFGGILMILLAAVAYLGFFVFLSVKRGTEGPNKYGDDPLQVAT